MEKTFKNRTEMIKSLPKNMKVAELGVFKGDFSKELFEIMLPSNLYLIDIFNGIMGSGDKDGNNMQYINLNEHYTNLNNYFTSFSNVKLLKGTTLEQMSKFEDDYLDMVYIDASHEYLDVKNDLEISYHKVKSNGYILGHDYEPNRFPGVVNAVNEFCDKYNLSINSLSDDGLPSFLIKLKK
jgi:hypothetical protein